MSRLSRRAAIREFYRQQQNKPTEQIQRRTASRSRQLAGPRVRAEQEREKRLIRALEEYAALGQIAIDHRVH